MRVALRNAAAAALVALTFAATGAQAQTQTPLTVNTDGTVALSLGNRQFLVPGAVAERISAVLRANTENPQALRQSICTIVAQYAGSPDNVELATAIVVLAIYHARGRSASVDAVLRGAVACNPALAAETLLALSSAPELNPREQETPRKQAERLQATAEDTGRVSPVQ